MATAIITRKLRDTSVYMVGSESAGYSWTADRAQAHKFDRNNALRIAREYNGTAYARDGEASVIDAGGNVAEVRETPAPAYKAKKRGFLVTIPADVSQPITREAFAGTKAPEYATLRKAVGGLIQPVKLKYEGRARDAWVDEEGLIKRLPLNPRATRMWHEWNQFATQGQILCGVAVLVLWEKIEAPAARESLPPSVRDVDTITEYGLTQKLSRAVRVF